MQIAFALKQNKLGVSVEEVSRKMGISEATFYNWKQKYGVGEYNEWRLHSSLNWMTPSEYALKCWETTPNNHATQGRNFYLRVAWLLVQGQMIALLIKV